MELREALRLQAPSLELQRSAAAEIARLDAIVAQHHEHVQRLECSLRQRDEQIADFVRASQQPSVTGVSA